MNKIFSIFYIFISIFISIQGEIHAGKTLALIDIPTGNVEKQELTPPNPRKLSGDWWEYYNVPAKQLPERILQTRNFLNEALKAVADQEREKASELVNDILANLEALAKEKQKNIQSQERSYKKNYTLEEFVGLNTELKIIARKKQELTHDIDDVKEAIGQSETNLNNLQAQYISMDELALGRIVKGLEIIYQRSSVALLKENLRLAQDGLMVQQENLQRIKAEIDFAKKHINYTSSSLEKAKGAINEAEKEYQQELSETRKFKIEYLTELDNPQISKLRRDFLQLKLQHSRVKDRLGEVSLINARMRLLLIQMGLNASYPPLEEFRAQLSRWQQEIADIQDSIYDWTKRSREILTEYLYELSFLDKQTDVEKRRAYQQFIEESSQTLITIGSLEKELTISQAFTDLINYQMKKTYTSFSDWVKHYWINFKQFFVDHAQFYQRTLFKLGNTPITFFALFKFIIVIVLTYVAGKILSRWILKFSASHKQISKSGAYALSRLAYYFLLIIGFSIAFVSIGFDFTAFAFIAGALTVGLGFGLQSIFNNFVSGIIILVEKNIRVGDVIELEEGNLGSVKEINVRTTLITTFDGIDILVPNSELVSKKFSNWNLREPVRRVRIPFRVSYESDKDKVRRVVIEAAKKIYITLEDPGREPQVWLAGFGDFSLNFELVVWVNEYLMTTPTSTNALYNWAIETALRENSIEIPYPKQIIQMTDKEV